MSGPVNGAKGPLNLYILDERGIPHKTTDVTAWAKSAEDRTYGNKTRVGPMVVSTVFLGINMRFTGNGSPVLWESMIFDALDGDDRQRRYTSQDEAEAGHQELVKVAEKLMANGDSKMKVD